MLGIVNYVWNSSSIMNAFFTILLFILIRQWTRKNINTNEINDNITNETNEINDNITNETNETNDNIETIDDKYNYKSNIKTDNIIESNNVINKTNYDNKLILFTEIFISSFISGFIIKTFW